MGNIAFYRKYRPQKFSDVVGQENVVQTLTNAISSDMVSHAYIFSGPRGSGKTTIARLLAKSLNCHNRKEGQFEPCDKCSSCLEIKQGNSLDLIEIDAASNRGIEEIRELKEKIKFSPVKEKYKIFIIDEAHQLTKEASNALLKTLEEPPPYAIFILATTEIQKMLPTIISRCQRFDFRRLTLPEIKNKLKEIVKKEKKNIEEEALNLIALNSGGSIRDAEGLLEQVLTYSETIGKDKEIKAEDIKDLLGLADISMVSEFVKYLFNKNAKGSIRFLNKTIEKGHDGHEFIKAVIHYLRQSLMLKISPGLMDEMVVGLTKEEQEIILALSREVDLKYIQKALDSFLEAENKMKYSPIPQLPIELAIISLINPEK